MPTLDTLFQQFLRERTLPEERHSQDADLV